MNSSQLNKLLEDLNADYHNLVYYCEVHWMSHSDMLTHYYLLRNEFDQLINTQGNNPVAELSDSQWLRDFAYLRLISASIFPNSITSSWDVTSF